MRLSSNPTKQNRGGVRFRDDERSNPGNATQAPGDDNYKKLHDSMEGVTVWTPAWDKGLGSLKSDVAGWQKATSSN